MLNVTQLGLTHTATFDNTDKHVTGFIAVSNSNNTTTSTTANANTADTTTSTTTNTNTANTELVVICFRGTVTNTNILTDLYFPQVHLPNLLLSDEYFDEMLGLMGHNSTTTATANITTNTISSVPRTAPGTVAHHRSPIHTSSTPIRITASTYRKESPRRGAHRHDEGREGEVESLLSGRTPPGVQYGSMEGDIENAMPRMGSSASPRGTFTPTSYLPAPTVNTNTNSSSDNSPYSTYSIHSYYKEEDEEEEEGEEEIAGSAGVLMEHGNATAAHHPGMLHAELSPLWYCCSAPCRQWVYSTLALTCGRETVPRVHWGFWEAYLSIRKEMMTALINTLLTRYIYIHTHSHSSQTSNSSRLIRIYCTGHSMGGALATIASLDISVNMSTILKSIRCILQKILTVPPNYLTPSVTQQPPVLTILREPVITVYSFGTPRVGNTSFAELVNYCLVPHPTDLPCPCYSPSTNHYRIILDGDLIPMIPKQLLCRHVIGNWKHCGTPILLSNDQSGMCIYLFVYIFICVYVYIYIHTAYVL